MHMRDIKSYEAAYVVDDFETKYQVVYRRKKVLEILKQYPHKRILEIGCGMESIAGSVDDFEECTIVEPSAKFAEHARHALVSSLKVEVFQDFFENKIDCLRDRNFDFILISSLLHELEQPKRFLEELASVASDKTMIYINVPNAKSFHRLLAKESGLIQDEHELSQQNKTLQQHNIFDMELLVMFIQETFESIGVQVGDLDTGGYFVKPFTHRQMEMCLRHGIFDEKVLDGLQRMVKYLPELASEIYVNLRIHKIGCGN